MTKTATKRRISFNLQTKILLLTLVPLLLVTGSLVGLSLLERMEDTQTNLAEQRAMLIEARKGSVRNVIETAMSAISPIVEEAGPNDADALKRARDVLRNLRFEGDNYVFVYDYDGTNLVLPHQPQLEGTAMLDKQDPNGKYLVRDMIQIAKNGGGFYQYGWPHPSTNQVEPKFSYAAGIEKWGWLLGAGVYVTDIDAAMADAEALAAKELRQSIWSSVLIGIAMFIGVALVAVFLVRRAILPIRRIAEAMKDIARGKGDLTRRLHADSNDEVGELAQQFNAFVERMQNTLREVRTSTRSVNRAAGEIAQSSEELASRTDQAAANLQETSASMEEITSTVNHSAESAQQANQLVQSTADVARQGETAMTQVEKTMDDINASAAKISDIITMIDSIAFQTNILALNASVEAARAGEHGRGFAVVAQEVRTLASRSSEASREIRELIDTSSSHTRSGAELVRSAGQTMHDIVASVARVTDVIAEISAGAKEQSSGIGQINTAVAEMDTMTQQNAAMVQQSSSAANEMREHAQRLNRLINSFVLGDDTAGMSDQATPALPTRSAPAAKHNLPVAKPAMASEVEEWEAF
ncbi:methyl-accepting chemotaxis sensory transducer with Cache sensor [Modicisalibacter xianhensis]|uniref:Methyl-accepting chemotaxis sensory transducer with Cache sensor n=1 Tax=Modicisalibacter xianhensis TaxID=442341 RepID=A0A4V3GUV0_9GAMM|nr:methyl-accepting chemotaxis protein [Halomonas xianhensis]TDX31554.1 methyl-accepting chemotaxis sensory transducer with Cache sensor [Halomonas xianhensis]